MKYFALFTLMVALLLLLANQSIIAQEKESVSNFSHKGLKGSVALGAFDVTSDSQLDAGQAVGVSLGYGFNDNATLWLGLQGAEFPASNNPDDITEFDAVEVNFQYKLRAQARLQPYGKMGLGAYQLKDRDTKVEKIGGGFTLAVGADYFVSRHFGFGFELHFKDIRYNKQRSEGVGGAVTTDISPELNRDSRGFLFTLTIQ